MNITSAITEAITGKQITRTALGWENLFITCPHYNGLDDSSLYISDGNRQPCLWIPQAEDITADDWVVLSNKHEDIRIGTKEFISICQQAIAKDLNQYHKDADVGFISDDVFTVWICKTLQNQKGLFATAYPDGLYYECTYSGDRQELYIDRYVKQENMCIRLGDDTDAECYSSGTVADTSCTDTNDYN